MSEHVTSRDPEVFIYELRPGCEAAYDHHHSAVWPEVIAELRATGFDDYTIHRRGRLVITVARRAPQDEAVAAPPEVQRRVQAWQNLMAPLFESVTDEAGALLYADKIFDLRQHSNQPNHSGH